LLAQSEDQLATFIVWRVLWLTNVEYLLGRWTRFSDPAIRPTVCGSPSTFELAHATSVWFIA